jgi:small-conductance mechanosensitive channel
MQEFLERLTEQIIRLFMNPFTRTASILVLSLASGILLRWAVGKWGKRIAAQSETQYDDIIIEALRRTILYIVLLIGINVAVRELPTYARNLIAPYTRPTINTGIILLITFLVAQTLKQIFRIRATNEQSRIAAMSLTRRTVEIVTYTVGSVMILRAFGVDVTAIVTALGVGGLAVALALQDTLSNAFAGVYITLARQIRRGDYIKTNDNFEGFVKDIGWRNTTIETLERNIVFIPNIKLSQSIVTNYFLPREPMYIRLTFGVHYHTDPDHLERILKELVRETGHDNYDDAHSKEQSTGKIRGLMSHPEPLVRFTAFGEYALQYTVFVTVNTFDNQFEARHEFMKRLYYVFRKEGIALPMPVRVLYNGVPTDAVGNNGLSLGDMLTRRPE